MPTAAPIARARTKLAALRGRLAEKDVPCAGVEWGGANVIISTVSRGARHREAVTPHALQMSGMFERLRDAFDGLVDGCSKFELYGRLELVVNAAIRKLPEIGAVALCGTLLDEADAILAEMSRGRFTYLSVALGVEIAQDRAEAR
jgi:hypothetical protein